MKRIAILGSTGSIGTQTIEVVLANPELFQVCAISGGTNIRLLQEQISLLSPKIVAVKSREIAEQLQSMVKEQVKIVYGEEGLVEVATYPDVDFVVTAVVGSVGLKPTVEAIKAKKQIGLANKETLVSAGHLVIELAKKHGVSIIPIDSEHSAIFQSLNGESANNIKKIILTASGGSFRDRKRDELAKVTVQDALKHPNWTMGAKITIDSATMMNKGLEVIEAHWLFNLPFDKIEVLIHPESVIHSMVEFIDQAIIAQLGTPDMKVPIQYALSFPNRLKLNGSGLDLVKLGALHFYNPDLKRFPALQMAYECGKRGGTMPTVLNAANEVIVEAFLRERIPFIAIESLIQTVLDQHNNQNEPCLEEIFEADNWARAAASKLIIEKGW